jgi:hypothetical protein
MRNTLWVGAWTIETAGLKTARQRVFKATARNLVFPMQDL